jgi:hypothetical protein
MERKKKRNSEKRERFIKAEWLQFLVAVKVI